MKLAWLDSWFKHKNPQTCFCLRPDGVAMVMLDSTSQTIKSQEFIEADCEDDNEVRLILSELATRYDLIGKPCSWVLMPGQYQLVMTEQLNVPMDEMAQALKWRMKGLLDYPLDDVAIDVFGVPAHGLGGQKKMVFLAAIQQSWLQEHVELFNKAYLNVVNIDVADLAIRRLLHARHDEGQPLVCLYLDTLVSKIIIYFEGNLYLIRQLSHAININERGAINSAMDSILLEVQRSFDYCVSELKLTSPSKLVVTPRVVWHKQLFELLQLHVPTKIESIDVNEYLTNSDSLSQEKEVQLMLAVGALLDSDDVKKCQGVARAND